MEEIKGYVEHIVYRNEENGYTVFNLNNEDGELTCVGKFHYIEEGELLELEGEYTVHKLYGTQLQVSASRVCAPEDLISIERYLGSGAIKGVGAALAGRIVKKFKEETFRIIEEEPERLAEVKGISERKAREIAVQVEEKKEMREAMIYLQNYGISTTLAAKIYIRLQIMCRVLALKLLMRSHQKLESIQIPISGSAAVFFILCRKVSWKDIFTCIRRNCCIARANCLAYELQIWSHI